MGKIKEQYSLQKNRALFSLWQVKDKKNQKLIYFTLLFSILFFILIKKQLGGVYIKLGDNLTLKLTLDSFCV